MPYSKQVPLIWLHDNLWDPINSEPEKKDEILERVKSDLSAYEAEDYVVYFCSILQPIRLILTSNHS